MPELTIKVYNAPPKVLTEEDLTDILCGAFEGGSNYWLMSVQVVDRPDGAEFLGDIVAKGGKLKLQVPDTDDDSESHWEELDLIRLARGLELYAEHKKGFNLDEMDATDYDAILQFAILEEIVFS